MSPARPRCERVDGRRGHRRPHEAVSALRLAACAVPLAVALLAGAAPSARAANPPAWMPPMADSLQRWASEAKVRFQEAQGDTVGGPNYRAYDLVGQIGRRLLRAYGSIGSAAAQGLGAKVDSLGLSADAVVDPAFPNFLLLMVRNPYKRTAYAVGFFYWMRGDDLRMQGAMFYGGLRPTIRTWWTGIQSQPYSIGVIDRGYGSPPAMNFTLFRLSPDGAFWNVVQYRENGPNFPGGGDAEWVDINADGRPELVVWERAKNDTLFEACVNCPAIMHEYMFVEGEEGFRLHDMRVMPSPYSTFTLFVRLLADGNRTAAARLLKNPAKLEEALADGWGSRRRAKAWVLEYGEEAPWPRWLEFLHHGPNGDKHYVVRFELDEGRWIISDWVVPRRHPRPGEARADSSAKAPPPAKPARAGAPSRAGGKR